MVLQGNFPPTDLMILNDEGEFSKVAVKHSVNTFTETGTIAFPQSKLLTEVWAELKQKVA